MQESSSQKSMLRGISFFTFELFFIIVNKKLRKESGKQSLELFEEYLLVYILIFILYIYKYSSSVKTEVVHNYALRKLG